MNNVKTTWTLWGMALLASLLAPAMVSAGSIEDRAGLFSKEAIRDAEVRLGSLQKEHNAELRIDTYATVPEDQKASVAAMSKEEKSKYFLTWMQNRAGEVHARGVVVLICKDPTYLEIGAGKHFRERGFTEDQRKEMTSHLMASFKAKKFDEGLSKLVDDFARDVARMRPANQRAQGQANAPVAPPVVPHRQGPGNMSWLWTVGLIVLGVWLISALFRGISHAANPMMGAGAGMPMGGGGFGGGFLSGLFGSMAGMWMYDSLFRGNHAWGSPMGGGYHDSNATNASWDDSAVGTTDGSDFEGSGGDWGSNDNGGGGFFGGGGDSGGFADFGGGGGDFGGGGGGDFGGGGGDWS